MKNPTDTRGDCLLLQEFSKNFLRQTRLLEDLPERAALHVAAMHRHGRSSAVRMLQRQMTAALFVFNKTRADERADESDRIHLRQPGQAIRGARTVTGNTNPFLARFSTGNGRPSRTKLDRWHSIASRTLLVTSSRESPWLKQPGKAGTSAQYPPSAAG